LYNKRKINKDLKMKKVLIGLALLSSVTSLASEKCTVQGYASIFLENGDIYKNVLITDQKFITRTKSWEDCYSYGLKRAKAMTGTLSLKVTRRGTVTLTKSHIFYEWSFNDSMIPFNDTSGKLTKYTNTYEENPAFEDLRYFSDGRIFE